MAEEFFPALEASALLGEDAFHNEQSRKLFKAIDELRSAGGSHEFNLPEVSISQNSPIRAVDVI